MDRLKLLVFSFYREEPLILKALEPLHSCQMDRNNGSIFIGCVDDEHLEQISVLLNYLSAPLALLSLGKQIVLLKDGEVEKKCPLNLSFHIDLFA